MRHRGPDDEGYVVFDPESGDMRVLSGPETPEAVRRSNLPHSPKELLTELPDGFRVGLGHRRLSIIDLSPAGHQPLCDASGRYWIAFNGEIYNYRELRRDIEATGYRFTGDSDTEVALAAYMVYGDACQERFNGMWTILIWDCLNKSLWLSRDRFGVKPLFYLDHHRYFAVASEIKSFLPLQSFEPDRSEILAYLADGPSESHPGTMFRGVKRFPAGHCASFSLENPPGSLNPRKYYNLPPVNLDTGFSTAALSRHIETYRELLKDAVRLRLHADVKVSCALSGGLDSSSITLLATDVLTEIGNLNRLATVSNIYSDPAFAGCDESRFVDLVAARIPVESFRTEPQAEGILTLDDLALWHYENVHDDIPVASLATFGLCRHSGLTVNLDGQGADESLAGYLRYFSDYLGHPPNYGLEFWQTFLNAPVPLKDKVFAALRLHTRADALPLERLVAPRLDSDYRASRGVSAIFADQPLNSTLRDNISGSLTKLLRNVDCHSMFHSVESRQPYMDYRLVEYLIALPMTYKIHNGWTKYLARVAFQDRLPKAVVWRKDKLGWPQPIRQWLAPLMRPGGHMDRVILGNDQLKDLLGQIPSTVLDDVRPSYRHYTRLYNLARHLTIFHEIVPDTLAGGQDPRSRLSQGVI